MVCGQQGLLRGKGQGVALGIVQSERTICRSSGNVSHRVGGLEVTTIQRKRVMNIRASLGICVLQ